MASFEQKLLTALGKSSNAVRLEFRQTGDGAEFASKKPRSSQQPQSMVHTGVLDQTPAQHLGSHMEKFHEMWLKRVRVVIDRAQPRVMRLMALNWIERKLNMPVTPPDGLEEAAARLESEVGEVSYEDDDDL